MVGDGSPELKYAEEFARLAEELHQERHEQPTVERIASLAVETIEACDYCGISVRHRNGRISSPASTSEISSRADALQDELAEGPCVDAIWQADTYLIDRLDTETRWPRWTPRAVELGIGSILSVRLTSPDEEAIAALNLYSADAHVFDHTDVAIASIYARHASRALTDARATDGMETALLSRQTIGVAQGILIQRFGLTLDQSFELLRRYSRDYNVKLRVLAENLVQNKGIRDDVDVAEAVARSFDLATEGSDQH